MKLVNGASANNISFSRDGAIGIGSRIAPHLKGTLLSACSSCCADCNEWKNVDHSRQLLWAGNNYDPTGPPLLT
jgi:hypothetical protein